MTSLFHVMRALAFVLAASFAGAFVIGNLWLLIGWMRFYGVEPGVVASAVPLDIVDYHNIFLNEVGKLIDSYNLMFQGNARFGSGIGAVAGAGMALVTVSQARLSVRVAAAALAGAIIGGRIALTFTSSPTPFLLSASLGFTFFALIQLFTHEKLPTIPVDAEWKPHPDTILEQ